MERLNHEFAAIGFYLSAHPLDTYGPTLEKVKATTYAELRESGSGHFPLAGIVLSKREINNRKGHRMAFVQFSDATGVYEVTLLSETLAQCSELLESGQTLLRKARSEGRRGGKVCVKPGRSRGE